MNTDRARIIAPPPLLGVGCIALGFVAEHYKPLPIFATKSPAQIIAGAILIVLAAITIFSARRVFVAHGTHPNPYTPTRAVVVNGVYRFSRNPIYISFLLVVLAFALFTNSFWFVVMVPVLFVLLHFGVVKWEERYLREKFGDEYEGYCRRVRRWI